MTPVICPECKQKLNEFEINSLWCTNCNKRFKDKYEIFAGKEEYAEEIEKLKAEEEREKELEQRVNESISNMIISTTPSLDGYVVEKYIDVICNEVLFKPSIGKQIGNATTDLIESFSFSERELSGTTDVIDKAKEYVKRKLIKRAATIGANAIIGIDVEGSYGSGSSGLVRVAMSGTAVIVKPVR